MSKLDPNLLLYKATQARNLPVMLEALANRADPNWVNQEEEGKTPLMKAVDTVRGGGGGLGGELATFSSLYHFIMFQ